MEDSVEAVEKILKYKFVNKSLLKDALSHTDPSAFDRLQILGSKALKLAITSYLHLAHPNLQPGDLTPLRLANSGLYKCARISANLGLYHFLQRHYKSNKRDTEVKFFSEAVVNDQAPLVEGGILKVPLILASIFESVAGAVYTDVSYHVHRLWEILRGFFEPLYTPDDLKQHQPQPLATLFRLADQSGKRVTFGFCNAVGQLTSAHVHLDDTCVACGPPKESRGHAVVAAAKFALLKLSGTMPVHLVTGDKSLQIQIIDAGKELLQQSSKLANSVEEGGDSGKEFVCSASKNPTEEGKRKKKKRKCSSLQGKEKEEKAENSSASQGFVCSANSETTTEEGGRKGKKPKCSSLRGKEKEEKAENSSASHMIRSLKFSLKDDPQSMPLEMVMDEKSLDIENENAKEKLIEKSPNPTSSVVIGGDSGKGFVCSATIQTPTKNTVMNEDSLGSKTGDAKAKLIEKSPEPN